MRETLGIAHLALLDPITTYTADHDCPPTWAHRALIDAHQRHFTARGSRCRVRADGDVAAYWATAAPRHYLGSGDPQAAIEFLESLDTPRPADNRDRWASWLPAFTTTLGPDHRDTLTARAHLADWRGEAGDAAGAVAEFEALLADRERVLDADHPDTLNARGQSGPMAGEAGDVGPR